MTTSGHKPTNKTPSVFIVAEISGNHNGDLNEAVELINIAANVGANAVKFQTYTPETISLDSDKADFLLPESSPWIAHKNYFDLYKAAFTPWEWHSKLFAHAIEKGLVPFSSPFDETAVDLLIDLDCTIFKLASPEINHLPLIRKIASTSKPIVISLGVANEIDLENALFEFRSISDAEITVLQCETKYPSELQDTNLNLLSILKKKYDVRIGLSDHTIGSTAAIAATALGASMIEKHLVKKGTNSVDSFFSADEEQFTTLVRNIREAESVLGNAVFRDFPTTNEALRSKRSIYPIRDISVGELFSYENIRVIRPGFSASPALIRNFLGKKAKRNIEKGERISLGDIQ